MVWKNLTGLHKSTPGPVHFCSLTFLRIITFAQGHCHAGTKHLKQKINLKMLQQSQKREVIVYILIDKIVGEYTLFLKQQVNSALKKKNIARIVKQRKTLHMPTVRFVPLAIDVAAVSLDVVRLCRAVCCKRSCFR